MATHVIRTDQAVFISATPSDPQIVVAEAGSLCYFDTSTSPSSSSNVGSIDPTGVTTATGAMVTGSYWYKPASGSTRVSTRSVNKDVEGAYQQVACPLGLSFLGSASSALTNSRAYFVRFVPRFDMVAFAIDFEVTAAGASGDACSVALYDKGLTRLATSGTVTTALENVGAAGGLNLDKSLFLAKDTIYYAAMSIGAVNASLRLACGTVPTTRTVQMFTSVVDGATKPWCYKASSHPLPTSVDSPTGGPDLFPLLVVYGVVISS